MSPFRKLPRGTIYHRARGSVKYLFDSMRKPLDREERVAEFESVFASYCGREYCVAFPFARTAIYMILKALDFPKGSEIIMPPITIKGIVDVVIEAGLVPVYVETDSSTICFDVDDLKRKMTPNVKVALITPLFGLVPDMDELMSVFRQAGVFVIEDFSQCLNGAFDGKRIGTFGDVGIFSASSIKTLDTLGGGMAITDDETLYRRLKQAQDDLEAPVRTFLVKKAWVNLVRNFATCNPLFSLLTFPLLQLIRRRNPDSALKQTGHRDKMRLSQLPGLWFRKYTSVQAEIGLSLIGGVAASDEKRVANAEHVRAACPTKFPETTKKSSNVYWQLFMHTDDAKAAQAFFSDWGIDVATSSLELVSALSDYPGRTELPVASKIYYNGIFIPCFPSLTEQDIARILAALGEYCRVYGDGEARVA